jgi:hypothetical protein
MKRGALLVGLLFMFFALKGQERFSVRYDSGFFNTLFMSVIEVDDGYVCTGYTGLSDSNARPMLFVKFDFEGNVVFQKEYGEGLDYYSSQNPDLDFLDESTLFHSGISFEADGTDVGYIARFSLEGDTIGLFRYQTPVEDPEFDWYRTTSVKRSSDDSYFMLATILQPETEGDFIVRKINDEGDLIWEHTEATDQPNDVCRVILPTDDGGVITVNKLGLLGELPNQQHFFKLNGETGEVDWEVLIDADTTSVLHDALLHEGGIFGLTPKPYWPNPSNGYWLPRVVSYDTNFNELWATDIWDEAFHFNHGLGRIQRSNDGHVIASGWRYDELDNPNEISGDYNDMGWIAKLDQFTGEILWVRYYQFLDLPFEKHRIRDMRPTSDGGFILCGEATDLWPDDGLTEPPYQQGWLLKLDEFGCLSEGCTTNVEEGENGEDTFFSIGPNPATTFVSIYQHRSLGNKAKFQVFDARGKMIQESAASKLENTSLLLDSRFWTKGVYVVVLRNEHDVLQTQKLLLE